MTKEQKKLYDTTKERMNMYVLNLHSHFHIFADVFLDNEKISELQGPCFKTKEEAEKEMDYLKIKFKRIIK